MTQLFIQLALSVTGAVIFIVAMLLVSAVIGYITAWLYAKSIYTPIIKGLESDKANLIKRVEELNGEIAGLNGKIDKLNERIIKLEEEADQKDKEIKLLKEPKKPAGATSK